MRLKLSVLIGIICSLFLCTPVYATEIPEENTTLYPMVIDQEMNLFTTEELETIESAKGKELLEDWVTIADDHPKLGKKAYVRRTSSLIEYRLENDILIYETRNSIYICPLKYMSIRPYRGVGVEYKSELISRVNDKSNILDCIIAVAARISKGYDEFIPKNEKELKEDYSTDELFAHITSLQKEGKRELEELENKLQEH